MSSSDDDDEAFRIFQRVKNEPEKKRGRKPKNESIPQSSVDGVCWHKERQKWHGTVKNVLERYENGQPRNLHTSYFSNEIDAIAARAALKARVDANYNDVTSRWAEEEPKTRGLPLGPTNASEADVGVVYWRPNYQNGYRPFRVLRVSAGKSGVKWKAACDLCATVAISTVKEVTFCAAHMPLEFRCPHSNGPRYLCTICNPRSMHYASKCSRCKDQRIESKRRLSKGGNGICATCESTLREEAAEAGTTPPPKGDSWETLCLKKLLPLVEVDYEMRDDHKNTLGALMRDLKGRKRKTRSGDASASCDTTTRRRPDLLYVLRCPETARIVTVIDVEIDEHSHRDYTTECEMGRVDDLFEAICKLAQNEGGRGASHPDAVAPIFHVLRLNPNACDATPAVNQDARIQLLAKRINAIADSNTRLTIEELAELQPPAKPIVQTFFYHSKAAAHHLAAFEQAGRDGSWQWKGNLTTV